MATVDELLIKLDATTEGLRREMTRAERSVSDMERKTDRHMKRFDKTIKDATAGAQRSMESLSARLGPVGALLSALGPAGLVAAAGIGSTVGVMAAATRTAQQFEQAGLKTEAILRATGQASGQTAESIRQMSREIALGTLASVQGVESAAQKLLTFRSVTGETFRRTIELSQDLAAVGFGTVESAAVQLGKALEDPQQGLTAMRRIGVSFTEGQREMILALQASGRELEAQAIILDGIEQQVGGAGAAEAGGLSGSIDTLGQRWEEFLEIVADRTDALGGATRGVNALAGAIDGLNNMLGPEADIAALDYWIDVQETLAILGAPADFISKALGMGAPNAELLQHMKDLRASLQRRLDTETALAEVTQERAEIDARAAQAERQRENAVAGLNKRIEAGLSAEAKAAKTRDEALAQIEAWSKHVQDQALVEEARNAVLAEYDAAINKATKSTGAATKAHDEFTKALSAADAELAKYQETVADTVAGMELENDVLRLQIEGRDEAAAWLQEEARLREQLGPMYEKHADQLRTLWEEERRLNREAADKDDAIRAWEDYAREVERVAEDVAGDVATLFWDGLTGEAKAQDALDFFKNWARRLGTEMLQQQIILPITTQIVGSMPGLFGVSRPSGAMAQAGAGGGAGGGVVGMASSLGGLGSLFGGGESVMGSIGSWIATSSLGQSLGLSAVQASAPGSVAAFGGIGQAVAGANATLTGAGEALVGGLNASPWGMIGSLGANLLGLGGGIGGSIGGMVGSVAGGALGSSMGTILGLAGGPVGAVIGGFLGSSLGGLFGGGKPKHPAGHAYVGPDGEVTRAASKHMGTGSLEVVARAALDSLNDAAAKVFGDGTRLQSGEVMAQFDNGTYALSNVQGSSFDEALPGFILKGLKQADLGTFSEDITLARKNSQAKTLDEFVSDIGFARSYRDEAEYMGPVVTPEAQGVLAAREEIAGLNQQFGVMREKVRELGLDMAPLEDAWEAQLRAMIGIGEMPEDLSPAERAVRQLRARMEELAPALTAAGIAAEEQTQALNKQLADMRQGFEQGIERTILEMTNPEEAARQDELVRYETQLRDARALGADLENVHELHRLRMLEIDEQYNAEQMQAAEASVSRVRQLADGLRQYVAGMGTSDLSPYGAEQRLNEAGGLYWQTLASARDGDTGAIGRLQDVSSSYLQQAQGYYGNASQQYAQIFQTTRAQLSSVVGNIDAAFGRSIERINFEPVTSGLNDVNTTLRQGQQASAQQTLMLRSELTALRAEVADLKSELARANAA